MTNFPTSLDTLPNPTKWDQQNTPGLLHHEQHANANDAVEALEAKVGIDSSAVTTSHDYKLRNLASRSSKHVSIATPGGAENVTLFFTAEAVTVAKLAAVLLGSATPSVTWSIKFAADRSAAGTEVITGGTTTTSTTTGDVITSFTVAAIPANSWVWLVTTAQSGTVTQLHVSMIFG